MLYLFVGQSCTGKSTVAEKLGEKISAEIYSGKDYLRMAKNEAEAWEIFYDKLVRATKINENNNENVIFIITEKSQLLKVAGIEKAITVKFDAPIDLIKERFASRMKCNLSQAVEALITRQYEDWKEVDGDYHIDTSLDYQGIVEKITSIGL